MKIYTEHVVYKNRISHRWSHRFSNVCRTTLCMERPYHRPCRTTMLADRPRPQTHSKESHNLNKQCFFGNDLFLLHIFLLFLFLNLTLSNWYLLLFMSYLVQWINRIILGNIRNKTIIKDRMNNVIRRNRMKIFSWNIWRNRNTWASIKAK